jgi:hypothetical protein
MKIQHYSALREKEMQSLATLQMSLEDIMLSKISQAQKDKHFHASVWNLEKCSLTVPE